MISTDPDVDLPNEHFEGDIVELTRDLVGRLLVVSRNEVTARALILEAEAYGGPEDPASHASFKPGGSAAAMWKAAGHVYVYAAYGMYPCLNIVCGPAGQPAAVLIRGVWVVGDPLPTFGPGRTTRRLGITLADHNAILGRGRLSVGAHRHHLLVEQTTRIGITRGTEYPWRFEGHWRSIEVIR